MCFWYLRRATDVSLPFTRLPLRRIPKKQTVIPAPSVLGPMPELNFPPTDRDVWDMHFFTSLHKHPSNILRDSDSRDILCSEVWHQ